MVQKQLTDVGWAVNEAYTLADGAATSSRTSAVLFAFSSRAN